MRKEECAIITKERRSKRAYWGKAKYFTLVEVCGALSSKKMSNANGERNSFLLSKEKN